MSDEDRNAWETLYSGQSRPWRGSVNLGWAPLERGMHVLDAGCGNGKATDTLLQMGCVATGIDFSGSAIESCRNRFGSKAEFEVGDIRSLPFGDSSFDAVLAVHSVEHVPASDEHLVFKEFSRILVPGGKLLLQVFAEGDFRSGGKNEDVRNGILYRYHSEDSLRLALSGWDILSLETIEERTRFGEVRRRLQCIAVPRKE